LPLSSGSTKGVVPRTVGAMQPDNKAKNATRKIEQQQNSKLDRGINIRSAHQNGNFSEIIFDFGQLLILPI
jgi:hypothetical protein